MIHLDRYIIYVDTYITSTYTTTGGPMMRLYIVTYTSTWVYSCCSFCLSIVGEFSHRVVNYYYVDVTLIHLDIYLYIHLPGYIFDTSTWVYRYIYIYVGI